MTVDENQCPQQPEASDDREKLVSYVAILLDRLTSRSSSRVRNSRDKIVYPEESFFKQLDSSIKKNNALIRKLKSSALTDAILSELSQQNVSKYTGEIVSALVEAKIRMADIPVLIRISEHMHQRYTEFSSLFLTAWTTALPRKQADMANVNVSKLRTDIRLFADLISAGIFALKDGLPILAQSLKFLSSSSDKSETHVPVLLTFCKFHAEEFMGVIPYSIQVIADKHPDIVIPPLDQLMSKDKQNIMKKLMHDYFNHLVTRIHGEKKELHKMDKQMRKQLMSRGEVNPERKEQFEQSSINLNKLISSCQQFADLLGLEFPELPPDPVDSVVSEFDPESGQVSIDLSNRFKGGSELDPHALFEDEESRSFYQSIPDIKSQIPAILYKDSVKDGASAVKQQQQPGGSGPGSQSASPDLKPEDEEKMDTTTTTADDDKDKSQEEEKDEKDLLNDLTGNSSTATDLIFVETDDMGVDLVDQTLAPDEAEKMDKPAAATKQSNKVLMDAFLSSLSNCVSRDHVDKAAVTFVTQLNNKANRTKLIRTLFTVPRNRLDLLPFYSRLVKILYPVMPHVAHDLVQGLKQDFKYHVKKKDQINIESKIKTMRFISELVKFEIFPRFDAINCLKILLLDFTHHQISMACTLIESCGRFLFRSSDSHQRMTQLLEQMMRKKSLLPYDSPYITVIENAYYSADTGDENAVSAVIERPIMHEYVRKLIYSDLCKRNVEKVCRQIRKLDWDDESLVQYIIKVMTAVYNMKFLLIPSMASLLSQLKDFHEDAVFRVIDGVMEDILLLMQVNDVRFNQRRIAMVKFAGELYNYRLIDSSIVFQLLYDFISFKVHDPEYDPSSNLFRIRLICTLLDSTAVYFSSAATKKKLDCFILFFQQYYWDKRSASCFAATKSNLTSVTIANSFPITIENLFIDTITALRPSFKFAANQQEANELVQQLVHELRNKVTNICPELKEMTISGDQSNKSAPAASSNDLNAIPEEEADEDSNTDQKDDTDHQMDEDEDEEGESGEENSSSSSSSDDEEDENESKTMKAPSAKKEVKLVPCPEDDDFLKEFEKIMTESILSRSSDNVKPMANIKLPDDYETMAQEKKVKVKPEQTPFSGSIAYPAPESTFKLTVMTRSGRGANVKPVLKIIPVPVDSELARELKEKEERIRREKQELKHLTLVMNDRIDEAEANNQTLPGQGITYLKNRNHHRHQKGAPDVDHL